jgi:pyroglutamyl-peptidase
MKNMKVIRPIIVIGVILLLIITSMGSSISKVSLPGEVRNLDDNETVILVTGFGPFSVYDINPSELIAEELDGEVIEDATIVGIILPVNFTESVEVAIQAIETYEPDFVISLGLAAPARWIRVEKVGLNLRRKNVSGRLIFTRLDSTGPLFRLSSIPTYGIAKEMRKAGIPARQSFRAGIYICNALLYGVLGYITDNNLAIKTGFIHVPLLSSQDPIKGMELDEMVKATRIAIQVCLDC